VLGVEYLVFVTGSAVAENVPDVHSTPVKVRIGPFTLIVRTGAIMNGGYTNLTWQERGLSWLIPRSPNGNGIRIGTFSAVMGGTKPILGPFSLSTNIHDGDVDASRASQPLFAHSFRRPYLIGRSSVSTKLRFTVLYWY